MIRGGLVREDLWKAIFLHPGNEDHVWELFHENSKLGRHGFAPTDQEVRMRMALLHESLPFQGFPKIELPRSFTPLKIRLEKALTSRVSVRNLVPRALTLKKVSTLLHYAYGVTRHNKDRTLPRPFRVV